MKKTTWFVIFAFTFLYLLLPTQSSTIDAWGYAACIRHGENLFLPHHLLYNVLGFVLIKIVEIVHFQVDTLAFMKSVNAIFGGMILYIFAKIQTLRGRDEAKNVGILVFVASTFGMMRFATENENYLIPIFFSLLGTFYFFQFIDAKNTDNQANKYILLASFWAAFACLFHQIHFWWWLGLGIGVVRLSPPAPPKGGSKTQLSFFLSHLLWGGGGEKIILYLLPSLLVPCVYMCVLFFHFGKNPFSFYALSHFILEDFYRGHVDSSISLQHFLLTPINFIRSFIQVHGNILSLIKYNILWCIPLIMSGLLVGMGVLRLSPPAPPKGGSKKDTFFVFSPPLWGGGGGNSLLLIFIFHFLFAFYSVGNAEFMVMLPILLALILSKSHISANTWLFWGIAMGIWNVGYGLFPNYYYKWSDDRMIQKWVKKEPNALFILNNKALIENEIYYFTGKELSLNLLHSPTQLKIKNQDITEMRNLVIQKLQVNGTVYTNAIENEKSMKRESFFEKGENSKIFEDFARYEKIDSTESINGQLYLWKLEKKL